MRGFTSWSALHEAVQRFENIGRPVKILAFTDFDPSGEDIVRALEEGFSFFEPRVEISIEKVALTEDDIKAYNLPPALAKKTDRRAAKFIARHGDACVELDALPPNVLVKKINRAIRENLNEGAFEGILDAESKERKNLNGLIRKLGTI